MKSNVFKHSRISHLLYVVCCLIQAVLVCDAAQAATRPTVSMVQEGEGDDVQNIFNIFYKIDGEDFKTVSYEVGAYIQQEYAPWKDGHSFSGWEGLPEDMLMPDYDLEVNGWYEANRYLLTYMVDNEVYQQDSVAYGTPIEEIEGPAKEGYTFSWGWHPETMPAYDVTITGSYSAAYYNIFYKIDGEDYKTTSCAFGSTIYPESAPWKEGHTFSGWEGFPEDMIMPASDLEVNGSYEAIRYELTYLVDGAEYQKDSVAYGTVIELIDEPTKEGYTFSGWSDHPETMPAYNLSIYGYFSVNAYTITYYVDGEEYKTVSYNYGATIMPEAEPSKAGHSFSGWEGLPEDLIMPAWDLEVNGSYVVNSYLLTYEVDGEVYQQDSVAYGSPIELIDEPSKEGSTFSGWGYHPETMPDHDITISGYFDATLYNIVYKIDGEEYKTTTCAYGATITPEADPWKEGHTFCGWEGFPEDMIMPASDLEINGSYEVNLYALIYIVDNVEYQRDSIAFGSEIILTEQPEKEGHTFSGWSDHPETMPSHDVTIMGYFSATAYNIVYKIDGEDYKTVTCSYGATIVPEAEPSKEGCTFSGWEGFPEDMIMPASDLEINGSYMANTYQLVYLVDNEEYLKDSVAFGTVIEPIEQPTKEGFDFSGWSEMPETMPAHDLVITGYFTAASFKINYRIDGEDYKTVAYVYGTTIVPEEVSSKEGHTFSGWEGLPADLIMPAYDLEVNGSYIANKYLLVYLVDNEEYQKDSVAFGSTIEPIDQPIKEGFTFSGWSGHPETMPAYDVVISGYFTVNTYSIIYKVDGEEYKTTSYTYGAAITPEAEPSKEGHTFSGWEGLPDDLIMPASDLEVNGAFSINTYHVTIEHNEGGAVEVSADEVEYGSSLTLNIMPDEGYELTSVMVNGNDITDELDNGTYTIEAVKQDIKISVLFTETVGIDYIYATPEAKGWLYDMSGRRVANPVQGQIYLRNGEKFLMK